ncbi:MAG: hypothetical protein HFE63_09625 [Clostridiales bacterium]|nr:hypothetical protein [Clostridiales bacterium]
MSFISEQLELRKLPELGFNKTADLEARRLEIVDILSDNIYGRTPNFKSEVRAEKTFGHEKCFAGHAFHRNYKITVTTPGGDYSFPLALSCPKSDKKVPLIVYISFNPETPSGFTPNEEICERGVALAKFCYTDITADRYDDFATGIAPLFPRDENATNNWGKLGMWAWAASRALDFLLTLDLFDADKIAVCGHSRLGKTALWCAAQDTRFKYVFSNNAGCSGDAITRGKQGEDISVITKVFNYWFCEKYHEYSGDAISDMPFDQHFLLAACSPRKVAVGASSLDIWADPESEYLCCAAASPAWEAYGLPGFIARDDRYAEVGESFDDGSVAFHNREGEHSPCRADWKAYIDFLLK